MPVHCAAYDCVNCRTIDNKIRGITFHKFLSVMGFVINIDTLRLMIPELLRKGV